MGVLNEKMCKNIDNDDIANPIVNPDSITTAKTDENPIVNHDSITTPKTDENIKEINIINNNVKTVVIIYRKTGIYISNIQQLINDYNTIIETNKNLYKIDIMINGKIR